MHAGHGTLRPLEGCRHRAKARSCVPVSSVAGNIIAQALTILPETRGLDDRAQPALPLSNTHSPHSPHDTVYLSIVSIHHFGCKLQLVTCIVTIVTWPATPKISQSPNSSRRRSPMPSRTGDLPGSNVSAGMAHPCRAQSGPVDRPLPARQPPPPWRARAGPR